MEDLKAIVSLRAQFGIEAVQHLALIWVVFVTIDSLQNSFG